MQMAAMIFRRPSNGQGPLPYGTWLKDLQAPIVLFSIGEEAGDEIFTHIEQFDSFDAHGLVELRVIELAQRFRYTSVFAQSEHDILRAAELRRWFGLAGQSVDSARAFRDKVYMKTLARAGGLHVPAFSALHTALDLCRFVREHGYPSVVKPRTGAGSRGVHVLRSIEDLKRFLQRPFGANQLAESFVEGPMFHVDGLVSSGRIVFISASKYVNGCLSHQFGESYGSVVLEPNDALARRLVSETEKLLAALPLATELAFHAEFFLGSNDRIIFCEVASRPGGSGIAHTIELAYGINLYQQWVRRAFALPIDLPPPRPWSAAGRLWIPPQRGRLLSLPTALPFSWVVEYRPNSALGQYWENAGFCTANVASFTVSGRDTEQVESRIRLLDQWFRAQLKWDLNEAPLVPTRYEDQKTCATR
jgi:hypothetical protein